jgi:hypothetical protein
MKVIISLLAIFVFILNAGTKEQITKAEVKKQMEREKLYAKEQKFYQGKDYNLKEWEVNQKSLNHIKNIEPEYEFDLDDAYTD